MAKVEIFGGICGFHTTVRATAERGRTVELKVESECPDPLFPIRPVWCLPGL